MIRLRKRMAARRGFSLLELLLAVIITSIIGGVFVMALSSYFTSFSQTEDYSVVRIEIQNVFGKLSAQISSAGLGLPPIDNPSDAPQGSFVKAFALMPGDDESVMSMMGAENEAWGGPITVTNGAIDDPAKHVTTPDGNNLYSGSELYYAWSEPLPLLVKPGFGIAMAEPKNISDDVGTTIYEHYDNYDIVSLDFGFFTGQALDLTGINKNGDDELIVVPEKTWLTFPTFGVPLQVTDNNLPASAIRAVVTPGAELLNPPVLFGGALHGYEQPHRLCITHLFVEDGKLIREVYDTPPYKEPNPDRREVLTDLPSTVWFQFEPVRRTLRMLMAVMPNRTANVRNGNARFATERPIGWPDGAPDIEVIEGRRILVESMTWRIRN